MTTLTIDLGFSDCQYFAIFSTSNPADTNTTDVIKNLKLSDRVWVCSCGATLNQDENVAINIRNVGLSMVQTLYRTVGTTGIAR